MNHDYEIVIGLEVHAELSTKSKMYCNCSTKFGESANTQICPICIGMPGVLPVMNKTAIEYTIKTGLATNCEISHYSKQDRKNYFYPDLPKAYQISQFDLPLCRNGHVEIKLQNQTSKKIGITRIHIEEDAGKLIHDPAGYGSLIDYNRSGVPLIEIVSEPDIRSAEEAKLYLETLKSILEYLEVSDCKMQEGSLRADINLSVRRKDSDQFGTRTEMKNLNSFKSIIRAIESESERQIDEISKGNNIIQETRRWDDDKGISYAMRSKEEAHDYRYFPDPDLPPIIISNEWIENIRSEIPELPEARKQRYIELFKLPEYDASVLTSSKFLADFFDSAVKESNNPKAISNWIMGDMTRILREMDMEIESISFPAKYLAELVNLIDSGKISGTIAKKVFEKMFDSGKSPDLIVQEEGLEIVNDENSIIEAVKKVLQENSQSVSDYLGGKQKAFGFLVGQTMKECNGKANPKIIHSTLKSELDKLISD